MSKLKLILILILSVPKIFTMDESKANMANKRHGDLLEGEITKKAKVDSELSSASKKEYISEELTKKSKAEEKSSFASKSEKKEKSQANKEHISSKEKEEKIDANQIDSNGRTALIRAVIDNDIIEAKKLVAQGANLNAQDKLGFTALMYCLESIKIDDNIKWEFINLLIKSNLDIQNPNDKENALILACRTNLAQAVNIFLKYGANPNLQNIDGETALIIAVIQENIEIASALLTYCATNPNLQNIKGETALILAVNQLNFDMVKLLIDNNAHILPVDNNDKDALDYINEKIVVLKKSSQTKEVINKLKTSEKIKDLILKQEEIISSDDRINLFKEVIMKAQDTELEKLLTKHEAEFSSQESYCLLYECLERNLNNKNIKKLINIVRIFLSRYLNIDNDIQYLYSNTLLTLILTRKMDDKNIYKMAKLLLQHNADPNLENVNETLPILFCENQKLVKLLCKCKADVNLTSDAGDVGYVTPLNYAARNYNLDTVKELINNKADVNLVHEQNPSPLMYAALSLRTDVVKLLLNNKANIFYVDANKQSALDFATNLSDTKRIAKTKETEDKVKELVAILKQAEQKELEEVADNFLT